MLRILAYFTLLMPLAIAIESPVAKSAETTADSTGVVNDTSGGALTFSIDPQSALRDAVKQSDWQQFHDKMESNYQTYMDDCNSSDISNADWNLFLNRELLAYISGCRNDEAGIRKAHYIVAM